MPEVAVLNLAKAHARSCSVCAAKMSEVSNLDAALETLRISSIRMEPPAAIGDNLLAAFRERKKRLHSPIVRVFPWRLVWGSAAAFGLVAVVVMLYSGLSLRDPAVRLNGTDSYGRSEGEHAVQERLPTISSDSSDSHAMPDRLNAERDRSSAKRPAAAASRRGVAKLDRPPQVRGEQRSSMLARDDWSSNGGGSIVRVTLPLSSLVAMGVPVDPEVSDPRVTADVVMDPFGAVMAIRLVEAKTSVN
jgi:hypothetical protein